MYCRNGLCDDRDSWDICKKNLVPETCEKNGWVTMLEKSQTGVKRCKKCLRFSGVCFRWRDINEIRWNNISDLKADLDVLFAKHCTEYEAINQEGHRERIEKSIRKLILKYGFKPQKED